MKKNASRHILWVQIYRQDKHLLHFLATVFLNVDYQLQNLGLSVVGVETGNGWLSVLEFWSYGEVSIKAASAQSMTTGHWSRSLKSTAARDEHCPYWDLKPRFGFFDEHSVYYTVQKCEKFGNVTKFNSSFLTFGARITMILGTTWLSTLWRS